MVFPFQVCLIAEFAQLHPGLIVEEGAGVSGKGFGIFLLAAQEHSVAVMSPGNDQGVSAAVDADQAVGAETISYHDGIIILPDVAVRVIAAFKQIDLFLDDFVELFRIDMIILADHGNVNGIGAAPCYGCQFFF